MPGDRRALFERRKQLVELDGKFQSPRFLNINQRELTRAELVCRGDHHHYLPGMFGEVDDVTLISVGGRVSVVGVWIVCWRACVVMKREGHNGRIRTERMLCRLVPVFKVEGERVLTRKSGGHFGVQTCKSFEKKRREACDVGRLQKFSDVLQPLVVLVVWKAMLHCLVRDETSLVDSRKRAAMTLPLFKVVKFVINWSKLETGKLVKD